MIQPSKPIEHVLSQVPLFQSLPTSELENLAATLQAVDLEDGDYLFCESDQGGYLYIIIEGQVQVVKATGTPEETVLGIRNPGEYIGEMSIFNLDGLRTASVRAARPTRLLEMQRSDFDALLARQPTLAYELVRVLSSRMTAGMNNAIHDLQEKNRALQQAYDELKAAQEQLIEKERLERELQVARQIQMSILPHKLPQLAGFDFGALMEPARAVGGDFYGMFSLDSERVAIAVGDVTDKGVPAAIFMAQTHALLRAVAHLSQTPAETLRRVNHLLLDMSAGGMFVTLLYGVLDYRSRRFDYARAGHELPLLRTASGEIYQAPLQDGVPLGLFDEIVLDENSLTVEPGSTLLLYSDGATDALDPQSQIFGLSNLESALRATSGLSGPGTCAQIFRALQAFQSGMAQFDDVTLVAIIGNPSPGRTPRRSG